MDPRRPCLIQAVSVLQPSAELVKHHQTHAGKSRGSLYRGLHPPWQEPRVPQRPHPPPENSPREKAPQAQGV